jgi:hypothetical protein
MYKHRSPRRIPISFNPEPKPHGIDAALQHFLPLLRCLGLMEPPRQDGIPKSWQTGSCHFYYHNTIQGWDGGSLHFTRETWLKGVQWKSKELFLMLCYIETNQTKNYKRTILFVQNKQLINKNPSLWILQYMGYYKCGLRIYQRYTPA